MTSKTIDIKIAFPIYNCQPGREEYDRFERNLCAHGGASDAEGWSLADCLMRIDDGAVDAAGVLMPGVNPIPAAGGGNQGHSARTCRRKRLKESYSFIIKHIDNADVLRALTQPGLLGDGPLALDYIRSRCRTAMDVLVVGIPQQRAHGISGNPQRVCEIDQHRLAWTRPDPTADRVHWLRAHSGQAGEDRHCDYAELYPKARCPLQGEVHPQRSTIRRF